MATRVLTHLRGSTGEIVLADFSTCLVDHLRDNKKDCVYVECKLEEGKFVICKSDDADSKDVGLMRHPPFCPIRVMNQENQKADLDAEIASRGVNVGICALVESKDRHVLLTRRASHMRTFPGVWVPPGGGLDSTDKSLKEAALRELEEETGLHLDPKICRRANILCLWESVYPPRLEWSLPRRHHVVVYYHFRLNENHKELNQKLKLEPDEVDACAWLCMDHVDLVVNGSQQQTSPKNTFTMKVLEKDEDEKVIVKDVECPAEILLAKAPLDKDKERISSGTRFALAEWLSASWNNNIKL